MTSRNKTCIPIRYPNLAVVALVLLVGYPLWLFASADITDTTTPPAKTEPLDLPPPLLPADADDWRDLTSGETMVDVQKDDAGIFLVRGTALIKGNLSRPTAIHHAGIMFYQRI